VASFRDGISNFFDAERPAPLHFVAKSIEVGDRFPHLALGRAALWDQAGHGLIVPGNHDFLAAGDTVEEVAESGFRFECADGFHEYPKID
jgi:hypothetical protein